MPEPTGPRPEKADLMVQNNEPLNESDWDQLVLGLRAGTPEACAKFWKHYGSELMRLADRHISERLKRRVGADDLVQSACRTFFRRLSDGQFELPDADALWRLMVAITVTKARRAARNHGRAKRDMNAEVRIDDAAGYEGKMDQAGLVDASDSPIDVAEFHDQMERLFECLSDQECQVVNLKLQQFTNREIAERMACSERTVRRLTQQVRERWNALFDSTETRF